MVNPQDVEAVIRRLAEARDQALREAPLHLHFKCQRCDEIEPIKEAVGVEVEAEFPPRTAAPAWRSGARAASLRRC